MTQVQFRHYSCEVYFSHYIESDAIALILVKPGTDEIIARASINIPEANIKNNEIAIKNYSENEGMLEALIKAGVVADPRITLKLDYHTHTIDIPVCKVLIPENERKYL